MSEKDKSYPEQQVVFDEASLAEAPSKAFGDTPEQGFTETAEPNVGVQILFDEQQKWLPEETLESNESKLASSEIEPYPDLVPKKRTLKSTLLKLAGVAFGGVVLFEAYDFFVQGFSQSPFTTGLWAIVAGVVGSLSIATLVKELRGLSKLKKQQKSAQDTLALISDECEPGSTQTRKLVAYCERLTEQLPEDLQAQLEKHWLAQDKALLTTKEVAELYSETVLIKVDEQVLKEVAKFSTEASVMVAISPVAIIDMLLLMWRNLKMIDKVSALYGVKLGYWGRVKLLRSVFANMAYAGASEMIADVGLDALGVDAMGKVSARFAQGLGAGMLTARLGVKAIRLCRPLPVLASESAVKRINSGQIRKQMLAQIKSLALKSR